MLTGSRRSWIGWSAMRVFASAARTFFGRWSGSSTMLCAARMSILPNADPSSPPSLAIAPTIWAGLTRCRCPTSMRYLANLRSFPRPRSAAYTATKHAVTGLTKSTSLDCRGYDIACGQIDIGNAATPLTERMVQGQGIMQADGRMAVEPRMDVEDVGRAVAYMAGLPLHSNVLFMTVMANLMPFVGRG